VSVLECIEVTVSARPLVVFRLMLPKKGIIYRMTSGFVINKRKTVADMYVMKKLYREVTYDEQGSDSGVNWDLFVEFRRTIETGDWELGI